VKGKDSVKKNQIIKTHTLNTVCEIQAVFNIFHCALCPVGQAPYYDILYYFTNISVYTNTAHVNNKLGLWQNTGGINSLHHLLQILSE